MHAFIISYQHLPNQKNYQHLRSHCVETTGSQHRQRGDTQRSFSRARGKQQDGHCRQTGCKTRPGIGHEVVFVKLASDVEEMDPVKGVCSETQIQ